MAPKKSEKTVTVTLGDKDEKKSVVRYNADDENAAISNVYVSKEALKKLGDPDEIKVTIEAA